MNGRIRDDASDAMMRRVYSEFLVDTRFLCRPGPGTYTRLSDGHSAYPRPRMAKAGLDAEALRRHKEAV